MRPHLIRWAIAALGAGAITLSSSCGPAASLVALAVLGLLFEGMKL